MKRSEENFLNMVHSVLENLKKYQLFWTAEAVIKHDVKAIERGYFLILGNLNQDSSLNSSGQSQSIDVGLQSIIFSTIKLCRRMYLYARQHNDEIIRKLVDHTEGSLSAGSKKMILSRCSRILSRAEWMHYYLQPYKVEEVHLAQLYESIEKYNQNLEENSKSKVEKTIYKPGISDQISDLKSRLDLLDELIEGLIPNIQFLRKYRKSRIVIDYSGSEKSENSSVYNDAHLS